LAKMMFPSMRTTATSVASKSKAKKRVWGTI